MCTQRNKTIKNANYVTTHTKPNQTWTSHNATKAHCYTTKLTSIQSCHGEEIKTTEHSHGPRRKLTWKCDTTGTAMNKNYNPTLSKWFHFLLLQTCHRLAPVGPLAPVETNPVTPNPDGKLCFLGFPVRPTQLQRPRNPSGLHKHYKSVFSHVPRKCVFQFHHWTHGRFQRFF